MLEEEKLEFFKKQIELEKKIVTKAEASVAGLKNKLVQGLILSIALDSKKHANLISALIALNSSTQPFVEEEKYDEIVENIEEHIKLELETIKTYRELLDQLDNEDEKMLIQAIYTDELKHHSLLKKLLRNIIKKETLTQEDIWDSIKEDFIPQY
jgi:rubrerythrin